MIIQRLFSSSKKKEKVKPHSEEWYDGALTDYQKKSGKRRGIVLGTLASTGIAGLGESFAGMDAETAGLDAEINELNKLTEEINKNSVKKEKIRKEKIRKEILENYEKGAKNGGLISKDMAKLQEKALENELKERLAKEGLDKLSPEFTERVNKITSGEIKNNARKKYISSARKKFLPLAAAAGIGIGISTKMANDKFNKSMNVKRRKSLKEKQEKQKNYSSSSKKEQNNKAIPGIIGAGVGAAGGIGLTKLAETQGGKVAGKIASSKDRARLSLDLLKETSRVNTLKENAAKYLKGEELEKTLKNLERETENRRIAIKDLANTEIKNIEEGAKLGFRNSKGMIKAKKVIPIATAAASIPVAIKVTRKNKGNENKKKK